MTVKRNRAHGAQAEGGSEGSAYRRMTGSEFAQQAPGFSRRKFIAFGGTAALTLLVGGSLSGCQSEAGDQLFRGERTITDQANRQVKVPTPDKLERIYFTSALGQVFVFSLDPSKLAGTGIHFTPSELAYLPEGTDQLAYMGSLSGGGEIDREALVAADVQLVFSISGTAITAANVSEAETLQDQTGIPTVLVDGSFDKIADAYRFLGDVMGSKDRAEKLATYLEDVYARVTEAVADVADSERVSLYYAEGPLGLQTEPDESQHALTFHVAGANNVAAVEETQGLGMSNVSLEQVINWDPQVIIAWDAVIRGGADQIIRSNASWSVIQAVRNGRVYTMPNVPFAWCDRPPGVNRFIGIQWVANMLYPDRYDVDMVEVTQDFYRTMYQVDISTDQALQILGNSYPAYGREAKYTLSDGASAAEESGGSDQQSIIDRSKGAD